MSEREIPQSAQDDGEFALGCTVALIIMDIVALILIVVTYKV